MSFLFLFLPACPFSCPLSSALHSLFLSCLSLPLPYRISLFLLPSCFFSFPLVFPLILYKHISCLILSNLFFFSFSNSSSLPSRSDFLPSHFSFLFFYFLPSFVSLYSSFPFLLSYPSFCLPLLLFLPYSFLMS